MTDKVFSLIVLFTSLLMWTYPHVSSTRACGYGEGISTGSNEYTAVKPVVISYTAPVNYYTPNYNYSTPYYKFICTPVKVKRTPIIIVPDKTEKEKGSEMNQFDQFKLLFDATVEEINKRPVVIGLYAAIVTFLLNLLVSLLLRRRGTVQDVKNDSASTAFESLVRLFEQDKMDKWGYSKYHKDFYYEGSVGLHGALASWLFRPLMWYISLNGYDITDKLSKNERKMLYKLSVQFAREKVKKLRSEDEDRTTKELFELAYPPVKNAFQGKTFKRNQTDEDPVVEDEMVGEADGVQGDDGCCETQDPSGCSNTREKYVNRKEDCCEQANIPFTLKKYVRRDADIAQKLDEKIERMEKMVEKALSAMENKKEQPPQVVHDPAYFDLTIPPEDRPSKDGGSIFPL